LAIHPWIASRASKNEFFNTLLALHEVADAAHTVDI